LVYIYKRRYNQRSENHRMIPQHDVVAWMLADAQARVAAVSARRQPGLARHTRPYGLVHALERTRQAVAARIVPEPVVEPACCLA
jgi:hypothetical protein